MIQIRLIQPNEWNTAKRLVYRVAHEVFQDARPLEEAIAEYEARGELGDMEDIQASYFENGGVFLVMLDNEEMIGTGAIRRYAEHVCELKRLWLLPEYHNKGLGYRMLRELLAFAKDAGYRRIRLEAQPIYQKRAVAFYKQAGFIEIPFSGSSDDEDILMEMDL